MENHTFSWVNQLLEGQCSSSHTVALPEGGPNHKPLPMEVFIGYIWDAYFDPQLWLIRLRRGRVSIGTCLTHQSAPLIFTSEYAA